MTGSPGRRPSIAVVGGGASAALFVASLAREAVHAAPCDITVFDRTGRFARGVAYGTKRPEHLLNVRAERMSAFENEPGHFTDWLAAGSHPFGPGDFAPRVLYGSYLEDVFARAVDGAETAGWRIVLKTEDVTVPPQADVVVTATGNAFPAAPRGSERLSAEDGYYADPFIVDYGALAAAGGGSVILLGTGLSMVDAAVSFHLAGFRGRITAISRHGFLPSRHAAPCAWPAFFGPGTFPGTAREALETVRREIDKAGAAGVPWQAVIDSLRPVTNEIWTNWSGAERRRFARLLPYWNVHRHRMPPSSADIVDLMMDEGVLAIRKDRIEGIGRHNGVLSVACAGGAVQADRVVNCLGYRAAPAADVPGGYALGPALSGTLLETTAVPEIRAQAAALARGIVARFPAPGVAA